MREQFDLVDGRLCNPKQVEVYVELVEHRNRRQSAGSRGGNAKAMLKQSPSKRPSNALTDSKPASASASASDANASSDMHFERFWGAYPKRAGGNPKRDAQTAFRQRIREGATVDEIMAGLARYVAFVTATKRVGTEYVMQAKRFVGPALCYTDDFPMPKQHGSPQTFDYDNSTQDFKGFAS